MTACEWIAMLAVKGMAPIHAAITRMGFDPTEAKPKVKAGKRAPVPAARRERYNVIRRERARLKRLMNA